MQSTAWYLDGAEWSSSCSSCLENGTAHGGEDRKSSTSPIQKFIGATEAIPPHTHTHTHTHMVLTNKHNEKKLDKMSSS
jgi:hypothetical protein